MDRRYTCEWVTPRCPPIEEAFRLLKYKAELSRKALVWNAEHERYTLDVNVIASQAARWLGGLQDAEESRPPTEAACKAILYTVPGLTACIHAYLYKQRGVTKNEVMALQGSGGIGKSTLAYYLARWLGGVVIREEDELIQTLYDIVEKGKWYPIMVFDDIAAMISKYWFMDREERQKWKDVFRLLEYSRDWTGLILLTARSFSGVARRFRELASLVGMMTRIILPGSKIVDVIFWYTAVTDVTSSMTRRRYRPQYIDILWPGILMPLDEYARSMHERRSKAREVLQRLVSDTSIDVT